MSSFCCTYICDSCHHEVFVGWIGLELNHTVVFCASCSASFHVYPQPGETLLKSNKPHILYIQGKKWVEVSSKKGRIKKTVLQNTWVDSGLRIPVQEDIAQRGDELYLVYSLVLDHVHCLSCQTKGSLVEYSDYVKHCPQCKIGTMSAHEI